VTSQCANRGMTWNHAMRTGVKYPRYKGHHVSSTRYERMHVAHITQYTSQYSDLVASSTSPLMISASDG